MAEKPLTRKVIREWPGVFSGVSPHAIPDGGAQVQTNLVSMTPGVLNVRKGHEPVTFTNATTATTGANGLVISQTYLRKPNAGYVVYQLANGVVKYGRR